MKSGALLNSDALSLYIKGNVRTPNMASCRASCKGCWGSGAQQGTDQGLTIPVQDDPVIRAFRSGENTTGEME